MILSSVTLQTYIKKIFTQSEISKWHALSERIGWDGEEWGVDKGCGHFLPFPTKAKVSKFRLNSHCVGILYVTRVVP